jgi:hypothetical protein
VPPSLFVRLIPNKPDLILTPVNLMRIEMPDHTKEYLGSHVSIQSPLEFQDYSRPTQCVSKWVLFVPPRTKDPTPPALQAVSDARDEFKDWIDVFRNNCRSCVKDSETKFGDWLADSGTGESTGLIVLSHHGTNSLFFYDGGSPAIQSIGVSRVFSKPSLAIVDACGTSRPGASEFIREFNEHGINSVVATSTEVEPTMAGRFLTILMDLLQTHSKDASYTLSKARFDAVKALSKTKDRNGAMYGPRALAFILAGNGAVRACVPVKNGPKQATKTQ